jgi:hypothetical protein
MENSRTLRIYVVQYSSPVVMKVKSRRMRCTGPIIYITERMHATVGLTI